MLYLKLGEEEQLNLEDGASVYPLIWVKNLTEAQNQSNKSCIPSYFQKSEKADAKLII